MRASRLVKGWGILITILLCTVGVVPFAGWAESEGITVNMTNVPFYIMVKLLVEKEDGKKVEQLDILSEQVSVVVTTATPVREILENLCKANGMDLSLNGDTYTVQKRGNARTENVKPAIDSMPKTSAGELPSGIPNTNPLPGTSSPAEQNSATVDKSGSKIVYEAIQLQNMSSYEVCWLLGVDGGMQPSRGRRRTINSRVQSLINPRAPKVNAAEMGGEYSSQMLNSSSPWSGNGLSGNGNTTDAYQAFPPPGNVGGGFPPAGGVLPPGDQGNNINGLPGMGGNTTGGRAGQYGSGQLKNFIPDGIDSIVGIAALNQLLVRGKSKEAIQQLADFLRLIDRPTKQVVVELMFVKMSVEDAFSLGSSFTISGTPFFVESAGTSTVGNFTVMYTQGNIQAQIATMLTNRRAKVVNAPRVVVQNGGSADIRLTETIPFILTNETEDFYGRITKTTEIDVQEFQQGMEVANATILPDNSVILEVYPELEDPSTSIEIPGTSGSGSVSGSNSTEINTIVRVKNGESIMMGGFVSENDSTASIRVPLLSDLPIIGPLLFRSTNNSKNNTETLFFLTPTIIFDDKTNFEGMTTVPPVF